MGLCTLGLSGGIEVTGQAGGINLQQAGDFAVIQVSNASPPNGPDITGVFALSGIPAASVIVPEFVPNAFAYGTDPVGNGGNWQFFQNCTRNDTNSYITGPFTPPSPVLQITLAPVASFYAVRIRLVSIAGGPILCAGNTNPTSLATIDTAILAQVAANALYNKAQVLALSDMNSTDYLAAVGGSF